VKRAARQCRNGPQRRSRCDVSQIRKARAIALYVAAVIDPVPPYEFVPTDVRFGGVIKTHVTTAKGAERSLACLASNGSSPPSRHYKPTRRLPRSRAGVV
jgi:hypothetical protein